MAGMRWDIFCKVIDNFGDVGVCWRLSADLARRGEQVRLWLDDPQALAWMAPGALQGDIAGIEVLHWTAPLPVQATQLPMADVWIEAFGCEPPAEWVDALGRHAARGQRPPVWINLEYLSAEGYVERSHRLPSPVMSGAARGLTKWFYYPGFTERTGGLLREEALLARQAAFEAQEWLAGLSMPSSNTALKACLFCYEPAALGAVMRLASGATPPAKWLVTPGRAWQVVQALQVQPDGLVAAARPHALPRLTQHDFDHLLWACDLNFVRGEDSLVRALWAGKPFVWQIYPQHDHAHHAKLAAFLDWLETPASLRDFHRAWNGIDATPARWPDRATLAQWRACTLQARQRLLEQPDLTSQLIGFVLEKR
jgi:uncharacterized repeat protein (TIGR03837 family)